MFGRRLVYIAAFLIFGLPLAEAIYVGGGILNAAEVFASSLLVTMMSWGALLVFGVLYDLSAPPGRKMLIGLVISVIAAIAIAVGHYYLDPVEAQELLRAGWGNDPANYKIYPITGYQFLGVAVFIVYGILNILPWFYLSAPDRKLK